MREKDAAAKAERFIRGYFASAKKRTAVLGLSGGLD